MFSFFRIIIVSMSSMKMPKNKDVLGIVMDNVPGETY